jgi:hypothetical protein
MLRVDSKRLDVNVRHSRSLTGVHKHSKRVLFRMAENLTEIRHRFIAANNFDSSRRVGRFLRIVIREYFAIATVPVGIEIPFAGARLRIETIERSSIPSTYRFKDQDQLRSLYVGLQIPEWNRIGSHIIHGHEVLLISLERIALAKRLVDLQNKYHISHNICGMIINWFALWLQENWLYLIRDNLAYWAAALPGRESLLEISANAIRNKLINKYDMEVDPVGPDGFRISSFIDCTITKTSRTGGGPMNAGLFARRFPGLNCKYFYVMNYRFKLYAMYISRGHSTSYVYRLQEDSWD